MRCSFVVKFESKNFYIATKIRQRNQATSREVAFLTNATESAVSQRIAGEIVLSALRGNAFRELDPCAN